MFSLDGAPFGAAVQTKTKLDVVMLRFSRNRFGAHRDLHSIAPLAAARSLPISLHSPKEQIAFVLLTYVQFKN
jgi:hypothetical protein